MKNYAYIVISAFVVGSLLSCGLQTRMEQEILQNDPLVTVQDVFEKINSGGMTDAQLKSSIRAITIEARWVQLTDSESRFLRLVWDDPYRAYDGSHDGWWTVKGYELSHDGLTQVREIAFRTIYAFEGDLGTRSFDSSSLEKGKRYKFTIADSTAGHEVVTKIVNVDLRSVQ